MSAMHFAQRQVVKPGQPCRPWAGRPDSSLEDGEIFQQRDDADDDHDDLDDLADLGVDWQALHQPQNEDDYEKRNQDADQNGSAHGILQSALDAPKVTPA